MANAVKVFLIWAFDGHDSTEPWLVEAWDEHLVEANFNGWKAVIRTARETLGAENVSVTETLVDWDRVIESFKPRDVSVQQ